MFSRMRAGKWAIALMAGMAMQGGAALAFHTPETLDELKPGENAFSTHGGEVIIIRAQSSGGNTTCTPWVEGTETIEHVGRVERHLYDVTSILQVHQEGTYHYLLPPELDETGNCSITVGPITRYEQLMLEARDLTKEAHIILRTDAVLDDGIDQSLQAAELQHEVLALYQQAIELEPQYPAPYYLAIDLLFNMNFVEPDAAEPETPEDMDALVEEVGVMFLSWPETARTPLISYLNTLADIYENSPEWQVDISANPTVLREFAEYIRTGKAGDSLAPLFYMGIEQTSEG